MATKKKAAQRKSVKRAKTGPLVKAASDKASLAAATYSLRMSLKLAEASRKAWVEKCVALQTQLDVSSKAYEDRIKALETQLEGVVRDQPVTIAEAPGITIADVQAREARRRQEQYGR